MTQDIHAERELIADEIAEIAYADIAQNYGENGLNPKEGHDDRHARSSVEAGKKIVDLAIETGRLDRSLKALTVISLANHDRVLNLGSGRNERASGILAVKDMEPYEVYTIEDRRNVAKGINGTATYFIGRVMFQTAGKHPLAQIDADADLANLGSDNQTFTEISGRIFREGYPEGTDEEEFISFQKVLLGSHKFYTPEAKIIFPHQQENLKLLMSQ